MPITIKNVSYTYQEDTALASAAVRGVSVRAYSGETIGIAGKTGSGKTTLVQMIAGLLLPDSGEIDLVDMKITPKSKLRPAELAWRISFVFQNPASQLFCETVEREIGFAAHNLGWDEEKTAKAVRSVMKKVGLTEDYLPRNPLMLSGGEKRRVALAAALVTGAPIIIMDEPLAGLDSKGKKEIGRLLRNLQKKENKIILIVSHDMNFIADYCDRVWLMSDGKLLAEGPVDEIFFDDELLKKAAVDVPDTRILLDKLQVKGMSFDDKKVASEHVAKNIVNALKGGDDDE